MTAAAVLATHSWWGAYPYTDSPPIDIGFGGGVHLAAYGVARPTVHVGGFFEWVDFSSAGGQYTFGLSGRAGRGFSEHFWLGGVIDVGPYFLDVLHETGYGLLISPRFEVELSLGGRARTKGAFFVGIGPAVVPFLRVTYHDDFFGTQRWTYWILSLRFTLGMIIGV